MKMFTDLQSLIVSLDKYFARKKKLPAIRKVMRLHKLLTMKILILLLLPLFGMGQSMRGDTIYYSQSGIGMGQDTIPCRITVVKKVQSFSPSITFDGWKIGNRYYCLDYVEVPKYYRVVKAKRKVADFK